ncbi:MAG: ParA family protein [Elusimicrobiota bacterium]
MPRVIAIINQKGGVGKTITAVNLSVCLARKNKRILLIDFDPQANASLLLKNDVDLNEPSVYDIISGDEYPENVAVKTHIDNLSLIPSNLNLAQAEIEIINKPGREALLSEKINASADERDNINSKFDYIILDCSPSLSILTVNALMAAKEVFIPMQMSFFAIKGAGHLKNIVKLVNEELEHDVAITGVIPTFYEEDSSVCREALLEVKQLFNAKVFDTVIHRSDFFDKAARKRETVFEYAPGSEAARDYRRLAEEVLGLRKSGEKKKKSFLRSLFKRT